MKEQPDVELGEKLQLRSNGRKEPVAPDSGGQDDRGGGGKRGEGEKNVAQVFDQAASSFLRRERGEREKSVCKLVYVSSRWRRDCYSLECQNLWLRAFFPSFH